MSKKVKEELIESIGLINAVSAPAPVPAVSTPVSAYASVPPSVPESIAQKSISQEIASIFTNFASRPASVFAKMCS